MAKNFWSTLTWGLLGAASVAAIATKLSRTTTMQGKNVLITGGSRGLGLELARVFFGARRELWHLLLEIQKSLNAQQCCSIIQAE